VVADNQVICTPGGDRKSVVALDRDTGSVLWSSDVEGAGRAAYSNGVVAEVSGKRQFITFLEHSLIGLAVADGELLWRVDGAIDRGHHPGTPIVRGHQVFCLNAFKGETKLLNLHLHNDAFVVREVYSKPIRYMNRYSDDAVIVGDHLLAIGSGIACCVDWKSGEVVSVKRVGKQCRSTYADGHLYTHEPGGSIRLVAFTGAEIVPKFKLQLPGYERALGPTTPVIANKCLFVRDDDQLYVFDLAVNSVNQTSVPTVHLPQIESVFVASNARASQRRFQPDAVFVPTPRDVVDRMLQLAKVTVDDTVVDLGSGDGRVIIAAAKKFGAKSIGYEIDPELVDLAERAIRDADLENQASVVKGDLFEADLSKVDVIMLYVLPGMMSRLFPKIRELPDGVRIVSHEFRFPRRIQPNKTIQMRSTEDEIEHRIHLYITPLLESNSRSAR
jgi:outer membrane protein assembly factor BamB